MKRSVSALFAAGMTLGLLAAGAVRLRAAEDAAVLQADQAWTAAAAKGDKAAAGKMLDADFTWTDANGKTLPRARVLQSLPSPALGDESGAAFKRYTYGDVSVVEADAAKMHVLRVWVKRPAGWRVLVYQEVKSAEKLPAVTPGAGKVCTNPCTTVGYTPKNDEEKAVVAAYMGLESSAVAKDADGFDAHTGDEFLAASSNSDRLLDKPTRMSELRNSRMAGLAPTPLISGKFYDFPGAVVMITEHKPDQGKPLHVTRVWVQRGNWVETISWQTSVAGSGQ